VRNLQLLALVFGTGLIIGCPIVTPPPSGCTSDTDCASGETCTDNACVPAASGCTTDADCASGETCTGGACVPAASGCTTDADCAAGETCTAGACEPATITGDAAAGETYFTANGCGGCHGADAQGPPSLVGKTAAEIYDKLSGAVSHAGGTREVTEQDAADLEAYIASL